MKIENSIAIENNSGWQTHILVHKHKLNDLMRKILFHLHIYYAYSKRSENNAKVDNNNSQMCFRKEKNYFYDCLTNNPPTPIEYCHLLAAKLMKYFDTLHSTFSSAMRYQQQQLHVFRGEATKKNTWTWTKKNLKNNQKLYWIGQRRERKRVRDGENSPCTRRSRYEVFKWLVECMHVCACIRCR